MARSHTAHKVVLAWRSNSFVGQPPVRRELGCVPGHSIFPSYYRVSLVSWLLIGEILKLCKITILYRNADECRLLLNRFT